MNHSGDVHKPHQLMLPFRLRVLLLLVGRHVPSQVEAQQRHRRSYRFESRSGTGEPVEL